MTVAKLSARALRLEHDRRLVLDVPALDVLAGEVLAVVGPNGAGKSSLLHALALLQRPSAGEVLLDGEAARGDLLPFRRRMAVAFQEPLLLEGTVASNVGSGLALRGVPRAERQARESRWLDRFGIGHLARTSARRLSGGEAQRVSLARALALEPEVLLLDEPFAALDEPTRNALINDLDRVLGESHTTVIFVTHLREEALRLGDRVAVLIGGRIRQIGPPSEVFAAPADEEVAAFLGVETIVPGRVRSVERGLALVDVGGRCLEAASDAYAAGADVLVCLRPENVSLSPGDAQPAAATSARNHLPARVERIVDGGPLVTVKLDAGFPLVALITQRSREELALAPGSRAVASFKATAVHLIPRHAR